MSENLVTVNDSETVALAALSDQTVKDLSLAVQALWLELKLDENRGRRRHPDDLALQDRLVGLQARLTLSREPTFEDEPTGADIAAAWSKLPR